MNISSSYKPAYVWLAFAILAFILFSRLGAAPIYILDEAKNAQCAREMLKRGDWVVPTFNGELRTDKPVLHYYFMMAAYKVFGVNAFAARFFSAVFGWLTVLITFLFTKRFINELAAFCTVAVLTASTHFLFEFRLSVPDPYLIFFITAGLLCAYWFLADSQLKYLLGASTCFGLATLAKGPVALALPGLCILIWAIWKKKWKQLFSWRLLLAAIVFFAITLPWYLAVHKATNGAWTRGFFIDHNINRFSDPQEGHGGFFLITLIFVIVGLLPFSANLAELIKKRTQVFNDDFVRFCVLVVTAFVVFFSISSTRLPNYAMPCYPFAAVIIGYYLSQVISGGISLKKYPAYIVMAIVALLPVAAFFALRSEPETPSVTWVPLILFAALIAFAYVFYWWNKVTRFKNVMHVFAAYSVFNVLLLHIVYPVIYLQNPVDKTIDTVRKYDNLVSYEIYNPAYNFYINQNVKRFYNIDSLKAAIDKNPNSLVITRTDFEEQLKPLGLKEIARHHDLLESPTTVLYAR